MIQKSGTASSLKMKWSFCAIGMAHHIRQGPQTIAGTCKSIESFAVIGGPLPPHSSHPRQVLPQQRTGELRRRMTAVGPTATSSAGGLHAEVLGAGRAGSRGISIWTDLLFLSLLR